MSNYHYRHYLEISVKISKRDKLILLQIVGIVSSFYSYTLVKLCVHLYHYESDRKSTTKYTHTGGGDRGQTITSFKRDRLL